MPDILSTTNVTFRPIDVKLGPDGALYIADWSNPIIQHGEVDFRDPRRDHDHGRIWRVTAKGRPLVSKPQLVNASNSDLLDQLVSSNAFHHAKASRVLTERGTNALSDAIAWAAKQTSDRGLIEGLWILQALNAPEAALVSRDSGSASLLRQVLASKDGRIRAAATRVIGYWHSHMTAAGMDPMTVLAGLVRDEHPRVRLEAIRALCRLPSARSAELALSILDKPMDEFLDYGLWLSINDLANFWVEAVKAGEWKIEGRESQLQFALQAIEPALAGSLLAQLKQVQTLARDGAGPWIELIGRAGAAGELRVLLDHVLQNKLEEAAAVRALNALAQAGRVRQLKPSGDLDSLATLLQHHNDSVKTEAVRLAGIWKRSSLTPRIVELAGQTTAAPLQQAAFESLKDLGGAPVAAELVKLSEKSQSIATRRLAAQSLAALDLAKGIPVAVTVLEDIQEEADALPFWRALLANKGAAQALTRALQPGTLPSETAKAGLRVAREGGRNEPELVLALARSGNLEEDSRQLTPAEIQQMVARVGSSGDPARGEKVYRRQDLSCVSCHAVGGVGGKVGPDMTSIGASAPVDYLIESMLFPNRKVKEGYHSILVETRDGQEISGIPVSETSDVLVVRDATNREVSVPKNNIAKRTIGGSLMPGGLLEGLSADQQIDLFRFLSELGKPGPYDASKGNTARLWRLLPATIDIAQFGDERVLKTDLKQADWAHAYSLVDGRLLKDDLEARLKSIAWRDPSAVYAATQFQSAKAGPVRLELSDVAAAGAWIDGRSVPAGKILEANLEAGTHTVILKFEARKLPEFVRLRTEDGTFLTN
jgi:putative heme-binding domain-containing protein